MIILIMLLLEYYSEMPILILEFLLDVLNDILKTFDMLEINFLL